MLTIGEAEKTPPYVGSSELIQDLLGYKAAGLGPLRALSRNTATLSGSHLMRLRSSGIKLKSVCVGRLILLFWPSQEGY